MKMSKSEYEELIRKKPSLRPTEISFQSTPNIGKIMAKAYSESISRKDFEEILGSSGPQVPIVPQRSFIRPPTLVFTIQGQPVGKPRQTISDRWKKRPCVMRYRAWADKARAAVPNGVNLGIYRQISFIAYLELPKSYSKAKRELLTGQPHFQKPDVDNILKSFDALFPEDKFIWKVSGEKRWEDGTGPRIEVELR